MTFPCFLNNSIFNDLKHEENIVHLILLTDYEFKVAITFQFKWYFIQKEF